MFLPDDPNCMWPLLKKVPADRSGSSLLSLVQKEDDEKLYNALAQAWRRRAKAGPSPDLIGRLLVLAADQGKIDPERLGAAQEELARMQGEVGSAPLQSAWGPVTDSLVASIRFGPAPDDTERPPPSSDKERDVQQFITILKCMGDMAALARAEWRQGRHGSCLKALRSLPNFQTPTGERLVSNLEGTNDPEQIDTIEDGFLVLTILWLAAGVEALNCGEGCRFLVPEERCGRLWRPMRLWLERLAPIIGARSVEEAAERLHARGPRHRDRLLAWKRRPKDVPSARQFRAMLEGLRKRGRIDRMSVERLAQEHGCICLFENLLMLAEAAAARITGIRAMAFFEDYQLFRKRALTSAKDDVSE